MRASEGSERMGKAGMQEHRCQMGREGMHTRAQVPNGEGRHSCESTGAKLTTGTSTAGIDCGAN